MISGGTDAGCGIFSEHCEKRRREREKEREEARPEGKGSSRSDPEIGAGGEGGSGWISLYLDIIAERLTRDDSSWRHQPPGVPPLHGGGRVEGRGVAAGARSSGPEGFFCFNLINVSPNLPPNRPGDVRSMTSPGSGFGPLLLLPCCSILDVCISNKHEPLARPRGQHSEFRFVTSRHLSA